MTTVLIHFERSEACAEAHNATDKPERVTVAFDSSDGAWVQLTYDTIRTQDGAVIAELGKADGCWFLLETDECFSDIVIEFVDEKQAERKANFERLTAAGYNPHKLSAAEYEAALELLDDDPSGEECPECGAEIDSDEDGDWMHVMRDDDGRRIGMTFDHQPKEA